MRFVLRPLALALLFAPVAQALAMEFPALMEHRVSDAIEQARKHDPVLVAAAERAQLLKNKREFLGPINAILAEGQFAADAIREENIHVVRGRERSYIVAEIPTKSGPAYLRYVQHEDGGELRPLSPFLGFNADGTDHPGEKGYFYLENGERIERVLNFHGVKRFY